jgi:hypothetical protein
VAVAVTANDSDPDDDPLTLKEVRQSHHGTAACAPVDPRAFRPQWRCVYTSEPGFSGTDDFAYAIADPSGETATATVQVAVAPAPTATATATATATPTATATAIPGAVALPPPAAEEAAVEEAAVEEAAAEEPESAALGDGAAPAESAAPDDGRPDA